MQTLTDTTNNTEHTSLSPIKLVTNSKLHLLMLIGIVLYCFVRTLGSYFLADDFGEIGYVSKIFHGHPNLLIANWIGPYIGNPTILVYRPWMHMSQVFDYLIWGINPFGYYLTNLLYFLGDTVLVYLLAQRLTMQWGKSRSAYTAFFIAALFAANPLHCGSISWMVGRVDVICCFYYLASIFLFISSITTKSSANKKLIVMAALVSYWLALLTKEMAIGLPVVLSCFAFLWSEQIASTATSFKNRLSTAFLFSLPAWISTIAYLAIRYLCLGTILGGYTGETGAAQTSSILTHLLDTDNLCRLVLPFPLSVFGLNSIYHRLAIGCYCMLLALVFMRLIIATIPRRWLLFLLVWALSTAAPIYKLWGLGYNLEGSRFYFFLTVPLSFLLPVLLFCPSSNLSTVFKSAKKKILAIASITLFLLICIFTAATYRTNLLWVHAGKEVKSFFNHCQNLANTLPPETQAILLGIPKEHGGALMILNSQTFKLMMSPPFVKNPIFDKFIVFDPLFFGTEEYINASRFKKSLLEPSTYGVLLWKNNNLVSLGYPITNTTFAENSFLNLNSTPHWLPYSLGHMTWVTGSPYIKLQNVAADDGLIIGGLTIDPRSVDFLECQIRATQPEIKPSLQVLWSGSQNSTDSSKENIATQEFSAPANSFQTVRVRLSHYWRWFASGSINELILKLFPAKQLEIRNIHLISATELVPEAIITNNTPDEASVFYLKNKPLNLKVDGSKIAGCTQIQIEISKPNFYLDNRDPNIKSSTIAKELLVPSKVASIRLDSSLFPKKALYQLRVHCLSGTKSYLGEYSDSITINRIEE